MMLSDAGHQLGMLSGGCLESDLQNQALRVLASGKSRSIVYDGSDEGSIAWQLGIGCGGSAEILLHPCNQTNDFLNLPSLLQHLKRSSRCVYSVHLNTPYAEIISDAKKSKPYVHKDHLIIPASPPPHLAIFGAGMDMEPLARIAADIGWSVSLIDQRASHYKPLRFPWVKQFLHCAPNDLEPTLLRQVDAAIIANHNVTLDAEALIWVQNSEARYCGILGPTARRQLVLATAGLREQDLRLPVAGPMGLALGGELPESVALSVLAECHAVLFGSSAIALSKAYFDH